MTKSKDKGPRLGNAKFINNLTEIPHAEAIITMHKQPEEESPKKEGRHFSVKVREGTYKSSKDNISFLADEGIYEGCRVFVMKEKES